MRADVYAKSKALVTRDSALAAASDVASLPLDFTS